MSHAPCGDRHHEHVEQLVAAMIAEKLTQSGALKITGELLLSHPQLPARDFTSLGLGSLDWMDAATKIEEALGIELPDELMLDPAVRTLAGWTAFLQEAMVGRKPPSSPGK